MQKVTRPFFVKHGVGGAQKKYLDTFLGMEDQTDCKTVEQWPLLSDPSLKIGGCP